MEEYEDNEEPTSEESVPLEAYPAHERVKSEMLNLRNMVSSYLHMFVVNTTVRNKNHKTKLKNSDATANWYNFQASVLSLYKNLKPHLRKMTIGASMEAKLKKLAPCFIDILKYGRELRDPEWIEIAFFLDEVVYDIGVSKIELDKSHQDEFI